MNGTVKSRDVFAEQFSSTQPFTFLQRINNPPVRLLRTGEVKFACGEPKLDAHFEGERIPCSKQNTVRGSRDDEAMKVDVMESVSFDILLARCTPDSGCLGTKGLNRSLEVRCRQPRC